MKKAFTQTTKISSNWIVLFFLLIHFYAKAQISSPEDPGRGLYVSNFFTWINGTVGIDASKSILGVTPTRPRL